MSYMAVNDTYTSISSDPGDTDGDTRTSFRSPQASMLSSCKVSTASILDDLLTAPPSARAVDVTTGRRGVFGLANSDWDEGGHRQYVGRSRYRITYY
jgi:hypothetical protein